VICVRFTDVAQGPGFIVQSVTCTSDHLRWSAPEDPQASGLVLVRKGRYRRRSCGSELDVDVTTGYFRLPGLPEAFAHPMGGDSCTWVGISPSLWACAAADLSGSTAEDADTQSLGLASTAGIHVDGPLALAHHRLLTAARAGVIDETIDAAATLIATAVRRIRPLTRTHNARPWPAQQDAVLVRAAKDAVLAADPVADSLTTLAARLRVSPYRLSRVFGRTVGVPLTRYRNHVRVERAIARLADGEQNLSVLAADLGFVDQAHLSRTLSNHVGHPPSRIRRMLRTPTTPR
jgi:AraC-like DNA-binding protein